MKIYVASSWRNEFQPEVVSALRKDGHEVYDFKDSDGFSWGEIDENWLNWTPQEYLAALDHHCANRGFNRDMTALRECDACVFVMPCGVSASMELGWAVGAGKITVAYVPAMREPDLMIKMCGRVTSDLQVVRGYLGLRDD